MIKRKLTPLVAIIIAVLVVPVAFALFPAVQLTTNLTVNEPLSISLAAVQAGDYDDPFSTDTRINGVCTISNKPPPSASCTISGFAGEDVRVFITVANAGAKDFSISASASSSSPDASVAVVLFCGIIGPCTPGTSGIVPGGSLAGFRVIFEISTSAAPGSVVTLTVEILR